MITTCCCSLTSLLLVLATTVHAHRIRTLQRERVTFTRSPVNATIESRLYVVGDSHGNTNFLVRSLLATGRFTLDADENIIWKREQSSSEFKVVVLGDFIDRGNRPRMNAMLLKRLSEDRKWGNHFVVVMGNHEDMLLRWAEDYAKQQKNQTDWPPERRRADLSAMEGEGYQLITWLSELPVIYSWHGVFMMHGGLSKIVADMVINDLTKSGSQACRKSAVACGEAAEDFINGLARKFYADLHQCFMDSESDLERALCDTKLGGRPYVLASAKKYVPSWSKLGGAGGVLWWFKGYTHAGKYGAGTAEACAEAGTVLGTLGAQIMVGAHVTHDAITAYCSRQMPIFAVDTHVSDCEENDECDFSISRRFHKSGTFHPNKVNIPQALKIKQRSDGSRVASKCLSMYSKKSGGVQVGCFSI